MSQSLMSLSTDYEDILRDIALNEGELNEDLELRLTKNLVESKEKVSGYVLVLNKFDNEIEFVKNQIKQAREYIERIENQKDRLEKIAMDVVNQKGARLEGDSGHWINKRKSSSLEIIDESLIPEIYSKITVSFDKAEIKNAILKRGEKIEGCVIKENESLSWK